MFSTRRTSSLPNVMGEFLLLGIVALFPLTMVAQTAVGPTAATKADDPAAIDQTWQKASSKYDPARNAMLQEVDKVNSQGPYRADWQSLETYQVPDWYKDAKFGIFIHWGVYSVPAFGSEWYPRQMYVQGSPEFKHHIATYGPQDKFGYKDFVPMFKAEKFDPAAWARLFKDSGAKYVVPVSEHHDGFAMYDSGLSDWTAVKMGPHRDLVGDLAKAVRAEGLHLGASSHRVEHNFFLGVGREFPSDINDPKYAAFYGPAHTWLDNKMRTPLGNDFTYVSPEWTHDWLARSAEIIQKYHPDVLFFDWWIGQPSVRADLTRFAAFYYNYSLKIWRTGGRDHLQGLCHASGLRGAGYRTRPTRRHSSTVLADRHFGQQQVVGLYRERHFQIAAVHCSSTGGRGQQERQPADEHRSPLRWNDSGRSAAGAAGCRVLAQGERRRHLRYAPVDGLRRRSDAGIGRIISRHGYAALHRGGFPLHNQRQFTLRH